MKFWGRAAKRIATHEIIDVLSVTGKESKGSLRQNVRTVAAGGSKWYNRAMFEDKSKIVSAALVAAFAGCASMKGEEKMQLPENAVLLDVRTAEEFAAGHIEGAVLLPHDEIGARIAAVVPGKSTPVFVYCRSGKRAGIAVDAMKALGYTELVNLGGKEDAERRLED